jgi:hypothetical protein
MIEPLFYYPSFSNGTVHRFFCPPFHSSLSTDLAENPLWHAVLRAAGGDGEKALSLLSDPEALRKHPEV